jgi:hypothetical protein
MRVITYILFILFLLSGGGSKSYANNSSNHKCRICSDKFSKSLQIKYNDKSHNSIIFLVTDFEIEEECDQSHDLNNTIFNKIIFEKFLFTNQFYSLLITDPDLDKILNKSKNFSRCCGLQNPIYITLQVLRI